MNSFSVSEEESNKNPTTANVYWPALSLSSGSTSNTTWISAS